MAQAKLCNIDGRWVILLPEVGSADALHLSVRRHGKDWVLEPTAEDQTGPNSSPRGANEADPADWEWLPGLARELDSEVLANAALINAPERSDSTPPVNLDLL